MTTYTDEVNIYNPDAIEDAIEEAGQTASNFITEVSADNGIVVARSGEGTVNKQITSATTGWHLGGVLEYIRQGISRFWIGVKSGDTTPTVRIGKAFVNGATDNESHMELDFHSLKLIDRDGGTYFHVSDLRDEGGILEVTDTFTGDGSSTIFMLTYTAMNTTYTVKVNGTAITSGVTKANFAVQFSTAPVSGCVIDVVYESNSTTLKAMTFGTRGTGKVGELSVAEGSLVVASGSRSHAEGENTVASGPGAHSEGHASKARGAYSHAQGDNTEANGNFSSAEGSGTTAEGEGSHAEGKDTSTGIDPVSGNAVSGCVAAHAEGYGTKAVYSGAHAEGTDCQAVRENSHAEGEGCQAIGLASHAQNCYTIAGSNYQTALGKYNEADANGDYAVIVGNGTSSARSNALAIDWDGGVDQWDPNIDMTTAPSSAVYDRMVEVFDKNGDPIGWFQVSQGTNGGHSVCIGASNSDDSAQNQLQLGYDANDNPTAWASQPATLRNALGVTDSGWQTLTLGSAAKAYESGVLPVYRKCFNVVNLIGAVSPKSQVAAGGSFDVGQLPSGYRPKQRCCTVCQGSGNSVYLLSIATGGTISIERYRNGASANAAMSTTAWLPFNVTFICA